MTKAWDVVTQFSDLWKVSIGADATIHCISYGGEKSRPRLAVRVSIINSVSCLTLGMRFKWLVEHRSVLVANPPWSANAQAKEFSRAASDLIGKLP